MKEDNDEEDERLDRLRAIIAACRLCRDTPAGGPEKALPHPSWRNTGWLKRHPWFAEELLPELRKRVQSLIG